MFPLTFLRPASQQDARRHSGQELPTVHMESEMVTGSVVGWASCCDPRGPGPISTVAEPGFPQLCSHACLVISVSLQVLTEPAGRTELPWVRRHQRRQTKGRGVY